MSPKASSDSLNYPYLGLTRLSANQEVGTTAWPKGFSHVDQSLMVGRGPETFAALAEGIMTWQIQRRSGLRVKAPPRAAVGARVVSGFGVGALRLPVPCEVVWAVEPQAQNAHDETGELLAGFGYGTLPGHPALGEEAFIANMKPDGGVHFRLLAFSRPAGLIYTLGSPLTKVTQAGVTRSYLQAARALVGGF